jgi:hypothetical protein
MDIKITYRKDAGHPQHSGEGGVTWAIEATGIENYDGDKAVQLILDAGPLMKVGEYGNARLIVEGLRGLEGHDGDD